MLASYRVRAATALLGALGAAAAGLAVMCVLAPGAAAGTTPSLIVTWSAPEGFDHGGTALPAYAAKPGVIWFSNRDSASTLITITTADRHNAGSFRIRAFGSYQETLPAGAYLLEGRGAGRAPIQTTQATLRLAAPTVARTSAPHAVASLAVVTTPDPHTAVAAMSAGSSPVTTSRGSLTPSGGQQSVAGFGRQFGLFTGLSGLALVGVASALARVLRWQARDPAVPGIASYGVHLRRPAMFTRPTKVAAAGPAAATGSPPREVPAAAVSPPASPPPSVTRIELIREPVGRSLGRHVEHDERSRQYPVALHSAAGRTVRHTRQVTIFNQGKVAAATGTAMAGWLGTNRRGALGKKTLTAADALALYELATHFDAFPGTYPQQDTGSTGLAVAKAAQQLGLITGYRHAFTIEQALSALAQGPVITGTNWLSGMDRPDPHGVVKLTGSVRGGHEYEVLGYNADTGLVECCNSWGRAWGLRGRFFLSLSDWATLLDADGDVIMPVVQTADTGS